MALRRIQRELADIQNTPPTSFSAGPSNDDLFKWEALLFGPFEGTAFTGCFGLEKTPFEGGTFKLQLELSTDYPFKPPKVKFLTKVWHPNVDEDGSICIGILKPDVWKPAHKLVDVLHSLSLILESPNGEDAINTQVAEMFNRDRGGWETKVREWVRKYATSS
ncbi:hypothetical protein HDV05_001449 [Chytridiales sp. JEL 0842]|nr:hypothetical protein HDV05_001449 [Chytridiales sp. JEL 0842]